MIVHDVAQGSAEWLQIRAGIPTASAADKMLTPKKLAISSQIENYINDLVAERFMGQPLVTPELPWMREGLEREPEAAAFYEMSTGLELQTVGFITTDDGRMGCSPDRLVKGGGLVELKNPKAHTHINYMLGAGPDEDYSLQLQAQLLIAEAEWVDIVSYYPGLPHVAIRVMRNPKAITKILDAMRLVASEVEGRMMKLKALGHEPKIRPVDPEANFFLTDADIQQFLAGREA